MKSKRQLQKENTRKKIINTAYHIYSVHGFTATTAMIAEEAKISHGTIFAHFQSLNELLESLIENFGTVLMAEIHDLTEADRTLEELLKTHLNILSRHEEFYIHLITERSLLPEEVQYTFANIQSTMAYHFNRILENEIRNQKVKEIPVHLMFNTWIGLIHYYLCNKDFFSPEQPVIERYAEELIAAFLAMINK